jgi:hypothetical protein
LPIFLCPYRKLNFMSTEIRLFNTFSIFNIQVRLFRVGLE